MLSAVRAIGFSIGAIILSAVLLVLALPLGEQAYLAWFALVPIIIASRGKGFLVGFASSLGSVLLAARISTSGLLYVHKNFSADSAWVYSGFGLFGFAIAIAIGVASERSNRTKPAWWFAAIATLLEACLLVELPAHLALSQYRFLPAMAIASVGGIWLVSFLVWLANFAIASLSGSKLAFAVVSAACLGFLLKGVGFHATGQEHAFATLQIHEAEDEKIQDMHGIASKSEPEMVVWPEFSALGMVMSNDTSWLRKISRETSPFVTTFRDDHQPLPHNVAGLFAAGVEVARYSKRRPFGGEKAMHAPGDIAVAASLGVLKVGLNICFDSCYPAVIRDTARVGNVNVIALPTIDPDSTNDFVAAVHASFTPFRAAENGVAFVRADGNAFSQIVDPTGRIVAETDNGLKILASRSQCEPRWTLYRTAGDWTLWVLGVLTLAGAIPRRSKSDKESSEPKSEAVPLPTASE